MHVFVRRRTENERSEDHLPHRFLHLVNCGILQLSTFIYNWITLSATWAVLPGGQVRATSHGSSVTTRGNRSTRRKPAMLGRVKLDNTLLTCDQDNFNQITARRQNRTLVTVVRDTCSTTVPPAPRLFVLFVNILGRTLLNNVAINLQKNCSGMAWSAFPPTWRLCLSDTFC